MPVYVFACAGCGPFELIRSMAEASSAARCPACGAEARRVFTPPGLRLLATPVRTALDMEEKSAHEPALAPAKRGAPLPRAHAHAHAPPWTVGH